MRKESTDMLWAWVWTENPSLIPQVKWVTLPARVPPEPGGRGRGRRGLRHRVLVHLAIVEDFTWEDSNGNPPPPYELPYKLGEVDRHTSGSRQRASPPPQDDRRGRRDGEDRGAQEVQP
ncbi:hypothetical protein ACQ4PT_057303 [Festuca glaucescens]